METQPVRAWLKNAGGNTAIQKQTNKQNSVLHTHTHKVHIEWNVCLCVFVSLCVSACVSVCVCLGVCLGVCVSVCHGLHPPVFTPPAGQSDNIEGAAASKPQDPKQPRAKHAGRPRRHRAVQSVITSKRTSKSP